MPCIFFKILTQYIITKIFLYKYTNLIEQFCNNKKKIAQTSRPYYAINHNACLQHMLMYNLIGENYTKLYTEFDKY